MKPIKPKPILTKAHRKLFKMFLFPTVPVFVAFGIVMKSKPTIYMIAFAATISFLTLLVDWVVRKRTIGNSSVGRPVGKPKPHPLR